MAGFEFMLLLAIEKIENMCNKSHTTVLQPWTWQSSEDFVSSNASMQLKAIHSFGKCIEQVINAMVLSLNKLGRIVKNKCLWNFFL